MLTDIIRAYAANEIDRDDALRQMRTEGYPAEKAEAVLLRIEGSDAFDSLREILAADDGDSAEVDALIEEMLVGMGEA